MTLTIARALRRRAAGVRRDDSGVAMITVLTLIMVVTALAATSSVVAVRNLQNANRDRQAGVALGASDAGVAQVIEYVRNSGSGGFTCFEATSTSCSSNPTGFNNPTSPQLIPLGSGGTGCSTGGNNCAKVWVGVIKQFVPPSKFGIYRVHSSGIYGGGPAARNTVVDLKVTPDRYPIGVFGATLSGNGGTSILTESLFTTQCISPRQDGNGNGTRFSGIDPYWDQPASAHTTSHVSTANNCGSGGYIQSSAAPCNTNDALKYDQTSDGGSVTTGTCYQAYTRTDGTTYPDGACTSLASIRADGLCETTKFQFSDLKRYGYRPRGLSDSQYAVMKARAKSQGLFNLGASSVSAALTAQLNAGVAQPVLYWDCSTSNTACSPGSSTVSLGYSDLPSGQFAVPPNTSPCPANLPVLTIVVEHGNMTWQGGNSRWIDASFFVPDGSFNGNGGYNILGTLFSNNLDLGGNQTFELDSCFLKNFPGPVLDVTQSNFREDDSKDVG